MDHYYNEYILEEQYISYNENNYDYGNNWEVQGWDGGIEIGPEYEEELGHGFEVEERFGEGVGVREEIGREWEEEGRGEGWEYEWDEPGQVYQDYQPETQADDEIGYEVPYGGSTPPWEHPYPTLDSPFANYMYTAPSQWTYQSPPLSPLLQLEMVADHPYPMAPTFQPSTQHTGNFESHPTSPEYRQLPKL